MPFFHKPSFNPPPRKKKVEIAHRNYTTMYQTKKRKFGVFFFYKKPPYYSVAELSTALPSNAGPIMWVNCALPPVVTMVVVQFTLILDVVDNSLYPCLFVQYLQQAVSEEIPATTRMLMQGGMIATCALLNIKGIEQIGSSGGTVMVLSVLPFALLFAAQCYYGEGLDYTHWSDSVPNTNWWVFIPLISWNFSGFENAGHVVEEVAVPGYALIRALVYLLALSQLVYGLPLLAGVSSLGDETNNFMSWEEGHWVTISRNVGGIWLERCMMLGGVVSAFGFTLCALCTTSRAFQGMCLLGCFADNINTRFGEMHSTFRTPANAIALNAVVTFILTATLTFDVLVIIEQVLYASRLIAVLISAVVLRYRHPTLPRPFSIPGGTAALCCIIAPCVTWGLLVILSSLLSGDGVLLHLGVIVATTVGIAVHTVHSPHFKLDGKIVSRIEGSEARRARNNSMRSCEGPHMV